MFQDIFDIRSIVHTLAPEQRISFICYIEGKQRIDLASCELVADALKVWAKKTGISQFQYWCQPIHSFVSSEADFYLSWNHQVLEIDDLTGVALFRLHFDISSPPFRDERSVLWIPILSDVKTPLLRSVEKIEKELKRLSPKMDLTPYVKIEQPFALTDTEKSHRVYDFEKSVNHRSLNTSLFFSEVDEIFKRRGIDVEIKKLGEGNYTALLKKEKAHLCIDQTIQMMEIMKKVGIKHRAFPVFHEKPFDIHWSLNGALNPSTLTTMQTVIHHAIQEHEDLLSVFLEPPHIENEWIFRGIGSLAHPAFALCAIHAAVADSLALMLDSKHLTHGIEHKDKTPLFASLLNPKTVRCYESILNVSELLHLQTMLLERYVKQMKGIVSSMTNQFRQKILPLLLNHELSIRSAIELDIAMLEDLDFQTRDLGIEIQAKVFSEIGVAKIEKAKLSVDHFIQTLGI